MNGDGVLRLKGTVSRQILFIVLGASLLLLIPLLAMQFTDEVFWGLFDFAVAGILLVGTGVFFVLLSRMVNNAQYRLVLGVALAVALLVVRAELAVGIFGTPLAGS